LTSFQHLTAVVKELSEQSTNCPETLADQRKQWGSLRAVIGRGYSSR